jgi:hypothetical protein
MGLVKTNVSLLPFVRFRVMADDARRRLSGL